MKQLILLATLPVVFLSCKTGKEKVLQESAFQIIIADTTKNHRAKWDLDDFNYRSKLEDQLGLSDLTNGSDSLQIRLWYDFSFSNYKELYTLKFTDSNCIVSYYRVYPRPINFEDDNRNRKWSPYKDPRIDSSFSKTVTVSEGEYRYLNLDSIWLLKSQSDLQIPDSINLTDCDSYIIEIADKKRLKYLRHHCPYAYYEKTKLKAILDFEIFCSRITSIAIKNKVVIERNYD